MAKIFGRLINNIKNSKLVPKYLVSSGHTPNFNSNSNSNFSTNIIFSRYKSDDDPKKTTFYSYPITDDDVSVVPTAFLDYNGGPIDLCGLSHDTVCVYNDGNVFLYNLLTGYCHQLPPSLIYSSLYRNCPLNCFLVHRYGFCYLTESNDFKVFRIVQFENYCIDDPIIEYSFAEVYNSSTDRWRVIEPYLFSHHLHKIHLCYKGVFYWLSFGERDQQFIQSFDMIEEVFNFIPITDDFTFGTLKISVWNGSIVLFTYPGKRYEKAIDIWAFDKADEYWSKIFTIGPLRWIKKPLLFVNSDELLIEADDGHVISYNVLTKQVKNLLPKMDRCILESSFVY